MSFPGTMSAPVGHCQMGVTMPCGTAICASAPRGASESSSSSADADADAEEGAEEDARARGLARLRIQRRLELSLIVAQRGVSAASAATVNDAAAAPAEAPTLC